ncbi:hypothetical protein DL770_002117 [Monosporascus sp. CRB-9-2]|nr:hypothetical protein DL770_002117 [Monosporascus sp. CRB-9-2]
MASKGDIQLAALAAGFTLGFGFFTVWEAIKQTHRNRNPLRSAYIYMVWGEIIANLGLGVLAWIWLDGVLGDKPSVPLLFFILFFWVFEIQLLLQIIINRIAIVAESRKTIFYLKWGTAIFITMVNVAVFCIFIPSHTVPPRSQTYVDVNRIWDRMSKVLICLVDAGLNWYFSRTVKNRLVKQHGLVKYRRIVGYTNKLMIVSVLMDVMLIGLMSLPNGIVFTQFHPVTYMVKLNIEMSMASLITKVARETGMGHDAKTPSSGVADSRHLTGKGTRSGVHDTPNDAVMMRSFHVAAVGGGGSEDDLDRYKGEAGIHRRVDVHVESASTSESIGREKGRPFGNGEDEMVLTHHAGHPRSRDAP